MKKFTLLFFLIFTVISGIAQKHEIGADLGFGKGFQLNDIKNLNLWKETNNCITPGLVYTFIPVKVFAFNTGFSYHWMGSDNTYLSFIEIPVGFDLLAGKKVQGLFGTGLKLKYLLSYHGDGFYGNMENTRGNYQLGMYLEAGIKLHADEHSSIIIKTVFDTDITALSWSSDPADSDVIFRSNIRYSDFILSFGYRYRF